MAVEAIIQVGIQAISAVIEVDLAGELFRLGSNGCMCGNSWLCQV